MKRIIMVCLVFSLVFLSGCQSSSITSDGTPGQEVMVYYVNLSESGALSTSYSLTNQGEEAVAELYSILQQGQFTDGRPAVPMTLILDHSKIKNNNVILYLAGEYPVAGTAEELLCRFSLVQTMLQLDGAEGVMIYVNDKPLELDGEQVGAMTADSFVEKLSDPQSQPVEKHVTLYYSNAEGNALVPCEAMVEMRPEENIETAIVRQLIQGPTQEGMFPVLPQNTEVISVSVKKSICYVNLNSFFVKEKLSINEYISVYSIVNSLTELEEIHSVQLMIDGSADVKFGENISFVTPLERNMNFVLEQ